MFQIESYMDALICALKEKFAERLLYVGLQGSYLRCEATESSDQDVVVILDGLTPKDLKVYRAIVEGLPHPEKACGFICGRQELANWNPMEACNFLHGTKDFYGTLADYIPSFTREDVVNFVKLSVGNLYHELCHRYVHADAEENRRALPRSCKGVFFILQSLYYLKDGVFYPTRKALLAHLDPEDGAVMALAGKTDYDFDSAFAMVLAWCQKVLDKS